MMFRWHTERDEQVVARAMEEIAASPSAARPLPDPSFIWWKGQLLRRFEAEREATAPLDIGDRFHLGAAVLGALALAGGAWNQLPQLSFTSTEFVALGLGAVVLLSVIALAAIEATRER